MLIQYHKVICQDVFNQGGRTGFRAKRKPLEEVEFSRGLTEEIMNGDINGMFHIL
jgi:hypothetical protein